MKKCASCSKDLPDAALHCVFCGAKQAPAPAQPAGLQKTVMGYSAQEMLAQMKAQGVTVPAALQTPAPAPPPVASPPAPALFPQVVAPVSPALAPAHGSNAPTLFDPNASPRGSVDTTLPPAPQSFPVTAGSFNAPPAGPRGSVDATLPPQGFPQGFNAATEARAQAQVLGMAPAADPHAGHAHGSPAAATGATPLVAPVFGPSSGPIPVHAATPVGATPSYTNARAVPAAGPDPLGGLRMWALVWGLLILITFLLPVSLSPLKFEFLEIGDAFSGSIEGILRVLLVPAIGLLAIVVGAIPMGTLARGLICAILGLAEFGVFLAFADHLEWHELVSVFGPLVLLTGLILRAGYPGSLLGRILATLGALAVLSLQLVPVHEGLPIVNTLTGIGDLSTGKLVVTVLELVQVVLAVAALLVWLPRTSNGGAKVIYFVLLVLLALTPTLGWALELGGEIAKSPAMLLGWTAEFATVGLATYGLGAFLGKLTE